MVRIILSMIAQYKLMTIVVVMYSHSWRDSCSLLFSLVFLLNILCNFSTGGSQTSSQTRINFTFGEKRRPTHRLSFIQFLARKCGSMCQSILPWTFPLSSSTFSYLNDAIVVWSTCWCCQRHFRRCYQTCNCCDNHGDSQHYIRISAGATGQQMWVDQDLVLTNVISSQHNNIKRVESGGDILVWADTSRQ